MRIRRLVSAAIASALLLFFAGCQVWHPGGATYTDKKGRFHLQAPAGWHYASNLGADFLATKDGPVLQQIWVEQRELKHALPNAKRPLDEKLGLFELAEAVAGDMQIDRSLANFQLQENVPATLGGRDAFKITFTFRTVEKLHLSETVYGCIADGRLWLLRYRAPVRHYFERDLTVFEETAKTFRFGKT